jgi:hypothetical protein
MHLSVDEFPCGLSLGRAERTFQSVTLSFRVAWEHGQCLSDV